MAQMSMCIPMAALTLKEGMRMKAHKNRNEVLMFVSKLTTFLSYFPWKHTSECVSNACVCNNSLCIDINITRTFMDRHSCKI